MRYLFTDEDIARIGSTLYTSIQDAVDAVETNNALAEENKLGSGSVNYNGADHTIDEIVEDFT